METGELKRIVFTGDCLRTEQGEPNQWSNVVWLRNLLGERLQAITGLSSCALLPSPAQCWQVLNEKPSPESWSRWFWNDADDRLCEHLASSFDGALVVAIELPPILEHVLDRLGVPWIDVCVSPLRFLPDFALSFRFGPGVSRPCGFGLAESQIDAALARVLAHYGMAKVSGTVFFAQTPADRTLIGRDGFVDASAFLDRLMFPLWVKPHPLSPDNPVVIDALRRGGKLLPDNTYAVLSADVTVATISSSVAVEARCFGRTPVVFHPDVMARNAQGLTTLNGYRSSAFWREALAGFPLADADFDGRFVPNLLRSKLHHYALDPELYAECNT